MYVLHMSTISLTRDEAIRRLQTVESEIRRLGVRRLALFGSVLRNEARPDSDVDVLVEFAPAEKTFDRFMALADLLEDTLEHPVEVDHHRVTLTLYRAAHPGRGNGCPSSRVTICAIFSWKSSTSSIRVGLSPNERFVADQTLRRAFVRSLEIIGEAGTDLPPHSHD